MSLIHKTKKQIANNKQGVTMLEVLITITLLAIITGIAIPSYTNHTRSAKTTEAKSSLSQVYMAEKSFFMNWRFYTAHLIVAGVQLEGDMLYNVGFSDGAHYNPSGKNMPNELKTSIIYDAKANRSFKAICGAGFGQGLAKGCAFKKAGPPPEIIGDLLAEENKFRVMAIGDVINKTQDTSAVDKDVWCINQYKQIERVNDGTKKKNIAVTPAMLDSACPP